MSDQVVDIDSREKVMKYITLIRNIVNQDDDAVLNFFAQLGNLIVKKMNEASDPFFGTSTDDTLVDNAPIDPVQDFIRLYDGWSTMDSDSKNADAARMITNLVVSVMKQHNTQDSIDEQTQ